MATCNDIFTSQDKISTFLNEFVIDSKILSLFDIATIIYELYGHYYKFTSIELNTWYRFFDHNWEEISSSYVDLILIEGSIRKLLTISSNWQKNLLTNESDILLVKIRYIDQLIEELKKKENKQELLFECKKLFFDSLFEEKLNINKKLICFKNGVFDLESMLFRSGKREDYISLNIGYEYEEFSSQHEFVQVLENYLSKIKIDKETKEYILISMVNCLTSKGNFINIWEDLTEISLLINLFIKAFGNYAIILDKSIVTSSEQKEIQSIAQLNGKKVIMVKNLDETDCIKSNYIKELNSNNFIHFRQLFENPKKFKLNAKIFIMFKQLPLMTAEDNEIFNHIRLLFLNAEDGYNLIIEQNIILYRKVFLWYLIHKWYPMCGKIGDATTDKIMKYTSDYKDYCIKNSISNKKIHLDLTFDQMIGITKYLPMTTQDNDILLGLTNLMNSNTFPKEKPYYFLTYLNKEKHLQRITRDALEYLKNKTNKEENLFQNDQILLKQLVKNEIIELCLKYLKANY
ncbi:D5 DNA Primase [uncultured virus]|nr:D5 DNA Primase [uncultured virus]